MSFVFQFNFRFWQRVRGEGGRMGKLDPAGKRHKPVCLALFGARTLFYHDTLLCVNQCCRQAGVHPGVYNIRALVAGTQEFIHLVYVEKKHLVYFYFSGEIAE